MRSRRLIPFVEAVICSVAMLSAQAQVPTATPQTPTPTPVGSQEQMTEPKADETEYGKLDKLLSSLRTRNARQFAVDSTKGVDEASYVSIGGIPQWVTIRGQDRANPVLLFVHGGPGDVTNPWTFALFAPWERHFTMVQWDERGAGRTLRKNGPGEGSKMTLDRMAEDGVELAEYLGKHLGKEKIIVVGHSFGSILGLRMVRAKPNLFYAYVGTGQVADNTKDYAVAYDALLKKAHATRNQQALDDLHRAGPPPHKSAEGSRIQRQWANSFEGADQFLFGTIGLTMVAPGNSVQDINDSAHGQMLSAGRLVPQTTSLEAKDLGLDFAIPMFFFQGDEDFTTPTTLARHYLESIKAPKKEFVPIKGGHFAVFMNSNEFLRELVEKVRPLASKR